MADMKIKVIHPEWQAECKGEIHRSLDGTHIDFAGVVIEENYGPMCCPAHDDGHPSLHVQRSGGSLILTCLAGCHVNAVASRLREALTGFQVRR